MHLFASVKDSDYKDSFIFRATNVLFMNDPKEFVYGRKVFIKTLRDIESQLGIKPEDSISDIWNDMSGDEEIDRKYIEYLQNNNSLPFVISFSCLEDSLPMWLNYGDKGKGVCLAFKDNRDQPLKTRNTENGEIVYESFFTSDVYYHNIDKDSELYKLLLDTMKIYKEDVKQGYGKEIKDSYFDSLIQYVAPFIKTRFFSNECEVRLSKTINYDYYMKSEKLEFRCNINGNLIPYINIEIPIDQLEYIILGPLVNFRLTKMAIDMMSDRYLPHRIDVKQTEVQYRVY